MRQFQRGQRGLLGRFEDHRVARPDRRAKLPRHHHHRVIPRRDRGDDPHRVAADHAGMTGQIFTRHRTMLAAHSTGKEPEAIDDAGQFVIARGIDWFATVQRLKGGKGIGVGFNPVSNAQKRGRAFAGRGARPAFKGLFGCCNRAVHLRSRGLGHLKDQRTGARVQNLLGRFLPDFKAVADQQLGLNGHGRGPFIFPNRRFQSRCGSGNRRQGWAERWRQRPPSRRHW